MRRRSRFERAFGRVLRRLRLEADLSQEALAHRCGLHPTYVSQLERGVKLPTLGTLETLARALGKRPYQIVKAVEEA